MPLRRHPVWDLTTSSTHLTAFDRPQARRPGTVHDNRRTHESGPATPEAPESTPVSVQAPRSTTAQSARGTSERRPGKNRGQKLQGRLGRAPSTEPAGRGRTRGQRDREEGTRGPAERPQPPLPGGRPVAGVALDERQPRQRPARPPTDTGAREDGSTGGREDGRKGSRHSVAAARQTLVPTAQSLRARPARVLTVAWGPAHGAQVEVAVMEEKLVLRAWARPAQQGHEVASVDDPAGGTKRVVSG